VVSFFISDCEQSLRYFSLRVTVCGCFSALFAPLVPPLYFSCFLVLLPFPRAILFYLDGGCVLYPFFLQVLIFLMVCPAAPGPSARNPYFFFSKVRAMAALTFLITSPPSVSLIFRLRLHSRMSSPSGFSSTTLLESCPVQPSPC